MNYEPSSQGLTQKGPQGHVENTRGGCHILKHDEEVGCWIQMLKREMTPPMQVMSIFSHSADFPFSTAQHRNNPNFISFKLSDLKT